MKIRYALLAATMLSLPAVAKADTVNGFYVSLGGGLNIIGQSYNNVGTITYPNGGFGGFLPPGYVYAPSGTYQVHYSEGFALAGSAGYGFGNGLRVELEGGYLSNGLKSSDQGPGKLRTTITGDETKYLVMGNVLLDVTPRLTGIDLGVTPYVGVGLGAAISGWDGANRFGGGSVGVNNAFSGYDTRFAWQLIGGLSYDIAAVPGLALTLDYRFVSVPRFTLTSTLTSTKDINQIGALGSFPSSNQITKDTNHSVMVGLRYAFGAPAAAAPAAPVPSAIPAAAVSRSYLVFFDWDKAVLTDRAKQIVGEAAAASKKVQVTRIEVNGYTDTSGTPKYNEGLSLARAKAVMAELVKDGVPAKDIAIKGYGEANPLVPTGANVREPQNRRVEIILK